MNIASQFCVILNAEGSEVELINYVGTAEIPEQNEAKNCQTHEQVLNFLEKIRSSNLKDQFGFFHKHNNFYQTHRKIETYTVSHLCPLDQQISFVRYKMMEKEHGIRGEGKLKALIEKCF